MINDSYNFAEILGFLLILLFLGYIVLFIAISPIFQRLRNIEKSLCIFQAIILPISLFLSGIILIFHGWRLDPILQLAYYLLFASLLYLIAKDIYLNIIKRFDR